MAKAQFEAEKPRKPVAVLLEDLENPQSELGILQEVFQFPLPRISPDRSH